MGDQKKKPGFAVARGGAGILLQPAPVSPGWSSGRIDTLHSGILNIKLLEEQKFDAQEPVLVIKTHGESSSNIRRCCLRLSELVITI